MNLVSVVLFMWSLFDQISSVCERERDEREKGKKNQTLKKIKDVLTRAQLTRITMPPLCLPVGNEWSCYN